MNTNTQRAPAGGAFGANGEWYEGGKFINTVPENRKREGSHKSKPRKVEIEPYVYVVEENGRQSIYRAFAGIFGKMVDGRLVVLCNDQVFAYTGKSREEAQTLADRYNAGERWV